MNEIVLVRGDTLKLFIESIITADGSEYTLTETDELYFGMRKESSPETAVINKKITAVDQSETGLPIVLYPCETADIPLGNYLFDIRLVMSEENIYTIVPMTRLKIVRNITEIPKG